MTAHFSSQVLFEPISGQKTFGPDLPDYDALTDCIRCGRCLPVCPTYQETALETQSPRGRLNLLRAVEDGKIALDHARVEEHLYHCLDCRACNMVCPAGIPIGELIVQGRAAVEHAHRRNWLIRFALNIVLTSPRRAEVLTAPLRLIQKLKLDQLGVVLFGWLPKIGPALRDLVHMAPAISRPIRPELARRPSSKGPDHPTTGLLDYSTTRPPDYSTTRPPGHSANRRVGFFLGCVMNVAFADASRASVALMQRFGCEVVTPADQACCGAPHDDQGMKNRARAFTRRNIEAFERLGDLAAIVADCAACSGFLKEYAHALGDDPEWAERAERFSSKVRDITEWLDEIIPDDRSAGFSLPVGTPHRVVTYHEPCHLAHMQGVRRQPRALLARAENLDVRELPDATRCCGSAGIYNLTHPAMSKALLGRKMADVASTGAGVVVSANPGCLIQLEWGRRWHKLPVAVKHITEVILESLVTREA
ncbi:MAG TPA: (Fe-S)-binding protein [Anaerolineae bacterium]|nr:(Fe-S)-binding protein [Anaerolineae bacterium]